MTAVAPRVTRPTTGRIVLYTPTDDTVPYAAVVTAQRDTTGAAGDPLDSDMHTHLLVLPPGRDAFPAGNVAYDANGAPGTWHWPTGDPQ